MISFCLGVGVDFLIEDNLNSGWIWRGLWAVEDRKLTCKLAWRLAEDVMENDPRLPCLSWM